MSSGKNNDNGLARLAILIAVGIIVYTTFIHRPSNSSPSAPRSATPPSAAAPAPFPAASAQPGPLDDELRPPTGLQQKDGVAAAILVDLSGSMAEKVPDANGGKSPKIDIARRAVQKLVTQTSTFAKAHPDQNVQLAIYAFSAHNNEPDCREVVPFSSPDPDQAASKLAALKPQGGTPIGDALVAVKHKLDATGLRKMHIIVVTDGENNKGYAPADVVAAIGRLPDAAHASVYFVAFDVNANVFKPVRDAGALVMPAANENELQQTLDYVLTGKILVE